MSDNHKQRLLGLSEKLMDIVLIEADPANWEAANKKHTELTQQERGNRYWDKKNAAASLTLLMKVTSLINVNTVNAPQTTDDQFELGQQVDDAMKQTEKILSRIMKKQ